jgi:hypothetical protein
MGNAKDESGSTSTVKKYAYAAIRCKTCRIWLPLKYLGPEDGKTIDSWKWPDPPKLLIFSMK